MSEIPRDVMRRLAKTAATVGADPFLARVHQLAGQTPPSGFSGFAGGGTASATPPSHSPPFSDHVQLIDAIDKLRASIDRSARSCARLAAHYCDPREIDLFTELANELGYTAEAIGAIRTIIGGGGR